MSNYTNTTATPSTAANTTTFPPPPDGHRIFLVPVPWDWRLIVQLALAVFGIVGNSLVIHIFRNTRELKRNTTNTFIAALACADLITSITIIPFRLLSAVPNNAIGSLYCKVVYSSNVMWISIVASVITLTTLSVERYIAVAYPTRYKRIFTKRKTTVIIVCIWLFGFCLNTFGYYETFVVDGQCVHIIPSARFQTFLGCAVFLVEYLIPMIIMLATNIRSIQLLHKQARSFAGTRQNSSSNKGSAMALLQARRRVVYMLFVVIVTFIICWSPDQIAFLGFNLGLVPFEFAFGHVYRVFIALAFANSCFNPVIYIAINRNFRRAFIALLPARNRPAGSSSKESNNTLFETPLVDHQREHGNHGGIVEGGDIGNVNFGALTDDGRVAISSIVTRGTDLDDR